MDQTVLDDLSSSGLVPDDMAAKHAGEAEIAACRLPASAKGYVIPYFDLKGQRKPFYRLKLFNFSDRNGKSIKYMQPINTMATLYFPKALAPLLEDTNYIVLTEGEKKAALACKLGIPAVALGGVDNWRNRTFVIPGESQISQKGKGGEYVIKLPSRMKVGEDFDLANGLRELTDLISKKNLTLYIAYDTDEQGIKPEVQRAASTLALQLVYMGIDSHKIRQIKLPGISGKKIGLDDYLLIAGRKGFDGLLQEDAKQSSTFPLHPNLLEYLQDRLEQKLGRTEAQQLAMTVIADLDRRGNRLRSVSSSTPYFFDKQTHSLLPANFFVSGEPLHESPFGKFIYQNYGIAAPDSKVLQWIAAQFTGMNPVSSVEPKKVISVIDSGRIALQISDSEFVIVTDNPKEPIRFMVNGSEGILFEQGHVQATEIDDLRKVFDEIKDQPLTPWWLEVFKESVNLNGTEQTPILAALLYYISPWLLRWRRTQLPLELMIGEPGSGKSSLYEVRLRILHGEPKLRNLPQDLRDWYASIASVGGLHVIDNVQFTNKEIRQRISDEICRLITEPRPEVEMRKLYTTSDHHQMPVNTVFAMTAIQQPFMNADVIQRAAIFEMQAVKGGHDSKWVDNQVNRFGGRTYWIAHHLLVLHKFLVLAKSKWDDSYKSAHRLTNYEQSLMLMAEVFGIKNEWLPEFLSNRLKTTMTEADWTLEGIKTYVKERQDKLAESIRKGNKQSEKLDVIKFSASDISDWAFINDEFKDNQILTNSRSLGRYMVNHRSILERICGMKEGGMVNNKKYFSIRP